MDTTSKQIEKINEVVGKDTDNLDYYTELSAYLFQKPHKDPESTHCIFCYLPLESTDREFVGGHLFLLDILRMDFQQEHGVKIKAVRNDDNSKCQHNKVPKDQRTFLLNWSIPIYDTLRNWLQQTSDIDRAFAGSACADVDISRPNELLKLLADKETLDFVLQRGYDKDKIRLEETQKEEREEYEINYKLSKDFLEWFNTVEVDSMESFVKKMKAIYGHLTKLEADPEAHWFRNDNQFESLILRASWAIQNKNYEEEHRKQLDNLLELYNQVKETVKHLKLEDWTHIPYEEIRPIHEQERHSSIRIDIRNKEDVVEFKDWLQRAELKLGRKFIVKNFADQGWGI